MSSNQYYMRVRGRVLGPYEEEKLQALAQRGQLSKLHEVSTDGLTWSRASHFPNLFSGSPLLEQPAAVLRTEQAVAEPQNNSAPQVASPNPQSTPGQWFYTSGGMQRGPIDFSQLQLLAASGQLSAHEQVWTEGMPAWANAAAVPGLVVPGSRANQKPAGGIAEDSSTQPGLPSSVCKAAVSSRGWSLLVASVIDVTAILMFLGGFLWLIVGARAGSAFVVASSLLNMLHAIVWLVGGILLHVYCRRLTALSYNHDPVLMERMLDALRAFWVFVGVYLIVMLTFLISAVVYGFAAGVTLSNL